ncbi:MAG: PQQ-binding-like beta-propeller repeat protein [Acidobacteriota bacterium]
MRRIADEALVRRQAYGAIRALEVGSGELKWEFRLHSPPWAGVMSTAGGLLFGGSNEGNFFALDAQTGEALWQFQTGGQIRTSPISFETDGKQHIAIASGQALFVFALP